MEAHIEKIKSCVELTLKFHTKNVVGAHTIISMCSFFVLVSAYGIVIIWKGYMKYQAPCKYNTPAGVERVTELGRYS